MEEYTKIYTNYCTETYKVGLNTLKNEKGMTWNIYNAYRREMTLTVLDPVALFQKYILILQHKMDMHFELTREIYTDAINLEGALIHKELDTLENLLTRKPSLFTWLHRMDFWTTVKTGGVLSNFLSGIQNFYRLTNSNTSIASSIYGNTNGKKEEPITLLAGYFIYKLSIAHYWSVILRTPVIGIKSIDFFVTRSNSNTPLRYNSGGAFDFTTTILQFESCNKITHPTCTPVAPTPEIYSHILSYNKLYNTEQGISQAATYAFGWTHNSVDFTNTVKSKEITQIPSVKASYISTESQVIQGPGHTGGDLIKLGTRMELNVVFERPLANNYRIRIRYASKGINSLRIDGFWLSTKTVNTEATFTDLNLTNLKYENFKYIDINPTIYKDNILAEPINKLYLENLTSTPGNVLIIDKIEFIPITQAVLDYTEKQNLEKLQKELNNLFID
ncbi:insecticidal delta-endotoxin [Bacillus thuringiensis]|uniref:insecticidal delta-endotoxin n=1 Tax=Bacillus thuringiensis TaxID=1428 RepID=UPI000CD9554E|nr:insecticidal delta-endotoxin [Bacillus thuringiensis]